MPKTVDVNDLVAHYDAFLVDQFGVLLSGNGAYPFAINTVNKLASMGKLILMISNSGKRADANEARLTQFGFARDSYLSVLSSGEAAYKNLAKRVGSEIKNGTKVYLISRDDDGSCIEGIDLAQTNKIEDAELIILSGRSNNPATLDDYANLLKTPSANKVPCICINPDLVMLTETGKTFGTGRVATLYQELGGCVEWIGKPYPFIYEIASEILLEHGAKKIICVGDSPDHDILGGKNAGFDTALVRTGIYSNLSLKSVMCKCNENAAIPDYILSEFSL